ncbi:unnamed protein product [Blepharisma stoltei]|uniref:Splicing factor 1 helix-hairpin domain-containing protein n=1 Tax=Blepharisma stoltei TaxID=1481888 RepID=A0AAU9J9D4_9CILI|nr:unnamed protein product [Blepharisma stoltei]
MRQGGNSSTEVSIVPIDSEKPKQVNLYQISARKSRWEDGDSFRVSKRNSELVNTSKGIQYSRWSIDKTFTPPPLTHIPEFLTKDQLELILRQARIEDISRRLTANDYEIQDIEIRSPSPEPIYDPKTGQRVNTRESRAKEKLLKERNLCIEECLKIDPQYKPPADYKPPKAMRKLYIPQYGTAPPQSYGLAEKRKKHLKRKLIVKFIYVAKVLQEEKTIILKAKKSQCTF